MKTIKEISKLAGISIRTLRYYDEIGLLPPSSLSASGYRLYDSKAIERLQEIMFYRELELPLKDIQKIMNSPNYNKEQALCKQKALLEQKRNRLNGIIALINDVMKGVNTMSFEEFNKSDVEAIICNMKQQLTEEQFMEFIDKYAGGSIENYEEILYTQLNDEKNKTDLLKWFGGKQQVIDSHKPIENVDSSRDELKECQIALAALMDDPNPDKETTLISQFEDLYKKLLNLNNARAFLLDLSKEYIENEKLADAQDAQYGKGSSKYIAEAINRYYGV